MTAPPTDGYVYERTVENGAVQIPSDHAGTPVPLLNLSTLRIIDEPTVNCNGTVPIDEDDGLEVQVIVPFARQPEVPPA